MQENKYIKVQPSLVSSSDYRYCMFTDFVSMLFPEYCLMCMECLEKGEKLICIHCKYNLPVTNHHINQSTDVLTKFMGKLPVKHAWAYLKFTKQGNVQRVLHKLKYSGQQEIGVLLGCWYGYELTTAGLNKEFDSILPVPLHPAKLAKRGYNQSDTFAQGLSESMLLPWHQHVLQKGIANETQTNKRRLERWQNVKDVYMISDKKAVIDKRILLVDDVVTTGSTLEACARTLLDTGCREVSIATIATA
jgi:ComF family protein